VEELIYTESRETGLGFDEIFSEVAPLYTVLKPLRLLLLLKNDCIRTARSFCFTITLYICKINDIIETEA